MGGGGMAESRFSPGEWKLESGLARGLARNVQALQNRFAKLPQIDSNGDSRERPESPICRSLNTSARNAITGSKPSCSASSERNARSAMRLNLTLSCLCLRCPPKAHQAVRLPAAHAVRAAIHVGRGLALSATWIDEPFARVQGMTPKKNLIPESNWITAEFFQPLGFATPRAVVNSHRCG